MIEKVNVIGYYGLWDFKDECIPELSYDTKEKKYVFPKELNESVMVKMYNKEKLERFSLVYENDTFYIYKLV